uniref:CRAL-TRIO domain-containing protein n=1 Tax=Syphacia muris TaxID=451379 RepID=A0A0N5AV56_9BILA
MELEKQASKIRQGFVSLPGSRDRANGPVIIINIGQWNLHSKDKLDSDKNVLQYEELVSLLGYLAQIPEDEARAQGFTVLIDGRKAPLKYLRRVLRACQQALYLMIRHVVIIQPERFFEQQKFNFELLKEAYEFKTSMTSVHRLTKYIDVAQLPEALGGTFRYNANVWVDLRKRYENFIVKVNNWLQTTKRLENSNISDSMLSAGGDIVKKVATNSAVDLYKMGNDLLDDLLPVDATTLKSGNSDWNDAAKKIEQLLKQLKEAEEFSCQENKNAEQHKTASAKLIEDYSQGVNNLLFWICGAGEKWLLTLHEIGDSADDARQLVKEHLELEIKSKELMDQVDELNDMANTLLTEFPDESDSVESNKMQLNKIVKVFCYRIQRQKRISLQSVLFHEKLNDFSRTTDVLLESLCTEVKAENSDDVEAEKYTMERKAEKMENIYHDVVDTGISFIDELCVDESNSVGRAIARDYSAAVVHIRSKMHETRDRRRRCQDLLDVRRLKLQQLLQLYTCENDGEQATCCFANLMHKSATRWIEELYETLINDYSEIECNGIEMGIFQEDRAKLEETARSTYEYGKQLCQVALVLRRSLRMEVQPQLTLNQKLENIWGKFCRALSESESNINIAIAFYTTANEVNHKLDDLNEKLIGRNMDVNRRPLAYMINMEKNRLGGDMRELRHIAAVLTKQFDSKNYRNKYIGEQKSAVPQHIQLQLEEIEEKFHNLNINISKVMNCHEPKANSPTEPDVLSTSNFSVDNKRKLHTNGSDSHNDNALNNVVQENNSDKDIPSHLDADTDSPTLPVTLLSEAR